MLIPQAPSSSKSIWQSRQPSSILYVFVDLEPLEI